MDVMSAVRAGRSQSVGELVNGLRAEAVEVRSSGLNPRVQKSLLKSILKQLEETQTLFISMGASGRYGAETAAGAATEVAAHLLAVNAQVKKEVLAARKAIQPEASGEVGGREAEIPVEVKEQAEAVVYLCLVSLFVLLVIGFPVFLLLNLMADPVTTLGGLGIVGVCYWLKAKTQ
jgi:hypothetical protein